MAVISQDIYYSYQFYKLANNPSRKNIVLFFSLFTPGFCIIKSPTSRMQSVLYKLVFGIDYEYPDIAKEYNLYEFEPKVARLIQRDYSHKKRLHKKLLKAEKLYTNQYYPNRKIKWTHKRALSHLKNSTRPINEMRWCEQFMIDTQKNKQNLFIVIPPAASVYREVLGSPDKLFLQVTEMAKKYPNVTIINLFDSPMFKTEHFADCDHLNYKGAKVLTEHLWSAIDKKDKK